MVFRMESSDVALARVPSAGIGIGAQLFKCPRCFWIVSEQTCPICGENCSPMCEQDTPSCQHEIVSGVAFCGKCGAAICPECGSHDVVQISRVTGYLQDVSGWNMGKVQELKDRKRYDLY